MLNRRTLSWQTITLHWLTGLSFIAVFVLGLYMADLPRGPEKGELIGLHKSLGLLILLIASVRLVWRWKEGPIEPASNLPPWQEKAAKLVHGFLLVATLAMPISGIAMSVGSGRGLDLFGWTLIAASEQSVWMQELGSSIHHVSVNLIILAFVLHLAGAIKHQLVDKDGTLTRMLGRS